MRHNPGWICGRLLQRWPFFVSILIGLAFWVLAPVWGATMSEWQKQTFDFGAPDLRGSLMLPSDAIMQTAKYQPRQGDSAGSTTVVAKIDVSARVPANITVMAFDLAYPAAPLRVCAYEVQALGLNLVSQAVEADISSASLRSVQMQGDQFKQITFTHCLTRGSKMIAFHFAATPAEGGGEDDAIKVGEKIETFAKAMLEDMTFDDGKPVSHWLGTTDLPLTQGEQTIALKTSGGWIATINDFNGSVPSVVLLTRRCDGKNAGFIWLGVLTAPEEGSLSSTGEQMLRELIARQSPDFGEIKLVSKDRLTLLNHVSGEQYRFRFDIFSKGKEDAGEVLATVTRSDDKFYGVAWWSPPLSAGSARERFMARLPGLTTYDLAQSAMAQLIQGP